MIDVEECAALTAQLVSLRSCPGEEGPAQRFVADWLRNAGLDVKLQPTEDDRPNVIAVCRNGPGKTMFLNGHIDTVLAASEWEHDPWTPRREGEKLFGLGACDMKAGVAAMMIAALCRAFADSFQKATGQAPNFGYNQGVADTNLFAATGMPTLQFGPDGDKCHAAGEWVDVTTIAACARILTDVCSRLLPTHTN